MWNSERNARSIFPNSFPTGKEKRTCRYVYFYLFIFCFVSTSCLFSYLYTDFLGLFFFLKNFNHFLIKFHKSDLFNLINELEILEKKKKKKKKNHIHHASDNFAQFKLNVLYVFSEYLPILSYQ